MYALTRATTTLLGAALAGLLIWLASQMDADELGEYWALVGLLAAAGLTMALSQLLGGWTKWGLPRVSGKVFFIAFLPVLIAALWVVLAAQPDSGWLAGDTRDWAEDLGFGGLVDDLASLFPVLAFGAGLVFGLSFDTTGPRTRTTPGAAREPTRVASDRETQRIRREPEDVETERRESPRSETTS